MRVPQEHRALMRAYLCIARSCARICASCAPARVPARRAPLRAYPRDVRPCARTRATCAPARVPARRAPLRAYPRDVRPCARTRATCAPARVPARRAPLRAYPRDVRPCARTRATCAPARVPARRAPLRAYPRDVRPCARTRATCAPARVPRATCAPCARTRATRGRAVRACGPGLRPTSQRLPPNGLSPWPCYKSASVKPETPSGPQVEPERARLLMRRATNLAVAAAALMIAAKLGAWLVTDSVSLLSSLADFGDGRARLAHQICSPYARRFSRRTASTASATARRSRWQGSDRRSSSPRPGSSLSSKLPAESWSRSRSRARRWGSG